jgi:hypothetical protein
MASPFRYQVTEPGKNAAGNCRFADLARIHIKRYGQHSTTNVATDRLWVQELCSSYSNANTYIFSEMNVGHYSHMLHIWCTT